MCWVCCIKVMESTCACVTSQFIYCPQTWELELKILFTYTLIFSLTLLFFFVSLLSGASSKNVFEVSGLLEKMLNCFPWIWGKMRTILFTCKNCPDSNCWLELVLLCHMSCPQWERKEALHLMSLCDDSLVKWIILHTRKWREVKSTVDNLIIYSSWRCCCYWYTVFFGWLLCNCLTWFRVVRDGVENAFRFTYFWGAWVYNSMLVTSVPFLVVFACIGGSLALLSFTWPVTTVSP